MAYIGRDDCILNFTQQPVTGIDCDVYEEPVIVLTCSVESLSSDVFADPSDIEIRWYFYNGTEYELTTGVNHTRTGGNGVHVQVTSTINVSGTSNQNFAFLGEGFYYCQVQLTDMTVVTNSSQRFQVLNRDEYVQASTFCSERTFIASVESCAAYAVTVTVNHTTTDIATQATTQINYKEGSITQSVQPTTLIDNQFESEITTMMWVYVLLAVVVIFSIIIAALTVLTLMLCKKLSNRTHGMIVTLNLTFSEVHV